MAKSFSHPRIRPQRGGLRLSDQQRKAATMWYNWYAGGGGAQLTQASVSQGTATTLNLTFNGSTTITTDGWSIDTDSVNALSISSVSGSGTSTPSFTLSREILPGETITLSYNKDSGSTKVGDNDLQSITDKAVSNNVLYWAEDFEGTTIDTDRFTVTNPDASDLSITQSGELIFTRVTDNAVAALTNNILSKLKFGYGVYSVYFDGLVGFANSTVVFRWFVDANNFISLNGSSTVLQVTINSGGGAAEYFQVSTVPKDGVRVRFIVTETSIEFQYWDGDEWATITNTSEQSMNVGDVAQIMLNTSSAAADTSGDRWAFRNLRYAPTVWTTEMPEDFFSNENEVLSPPIQTLDPETDVPSGTPSLQITNVKTISFSGGTFDWHGRTACEVLADGTVVLVYRVATAHNVNDNGKLHIRFSQNYGETWTNENTYTDGTAVTGFPWRPSSFLSTEDPGEPWLILCPNGDLLVFGAQIDYSVSRGGSWFSRSTDGGKTWSTPAKISSIENFPSELDIDRMFAWNDHFILDDVIYFSVWVHTPESSNSMSGIIKSEDNGGTWEWVGYITNNAVDTLPNGSYEAGLCYVGNDTIITMMRNGANSGTLYRKSEDMGVTWGELTDVTSWGLTARHRFQQRSRLKGKNNWHLDPVVIASIFTHVSPGNSHPRKNGIQISKDFGETFPYVLDLDSATNNDDGGYNDLFYNPIKDEYVSLAYRGAVITAACIVQYNFKIIWS